MPTTETNLNKTYEIEEKQQHKAHNNNKVVFSSIIVNKIIHINPYEVPNVSHGGRRNTNCNVVKDTK